MYEYAPAIQRAYTRAFGPLARLFHVRLGLTPNQVSWISFFFSMLSIVTLFAGKLWLTAAILLIALFFDAIDGSIARIYGLTSSMGHALEFALDGLHEIFLYLGLAYHGAISYRLFIFVVLAMLLVKIYRTETGFDPGFRRVSYFFGLIFGFNITTIITFIWQLVGFVIQLIIKLQRYVKHRHLLRSLPR